MLLAAPDEVYAVLKGAEVEARPGVVDVSPTAALSTTVEEADVGPGSEAVDGGPSRLRRPATPSNALRIGSTVLSKFRGSSKGSVIFSMASLRPPRLWLVWTSAPTNDQDTVA